LSARGSTTASYSWLYGVLWLSPEAFEERSPVSMAVIKEVTEKYGHDTPNLGVIPDWHPTALTYGSGRYNARTVVSEGCFEYLDDELAAVMAHELGHVTSRDFTTMLLANTQVHCSTSLPSTRCASPGARTPRETRSPAPPRRRKATPELRWPPSAPSPTCSGRLASTPCST